LIAGVLALALAVPGMASAHGRHHRHHHKAHHARVKHIGAKSANDPVTPATGDAGTVASFTGGVLTIALADGSTASGKVTDQTEIECETAAPTTPGPTAAAAHDGGWGDGQGADDQGDDQGDRGDGGHHRCHGQSACTVADLVPGAVVHEADLRIGAGGSVFEKVTLVKQAPQTP
jgi:hypothetical protein